jgi:hypothetical protein
MKKPSKLVQSFKITTEEELLAYFKAKKVKPPWDRILKLVFLEGATYAKAGAAYGRTKHAVYEYLKCLKRRRSRLYDNRNTI